MANSFQAQFPGQTLMFGPAGEPPADPPLPAWDGCTVQWAEWEPVPATTHVDWRCENCDCTRSAAGIDERPHVTVGRVASGPDEPPKVIRLLAYWCGRCGRCVVYDRRHGDLNEVWVGLLS